MRQILSAARRFSPLLAIITVAGLLMLQPSADTGEMMATSRASGAAAAVGPSHAVRVVSAGVPNMPVGAADRSTGCPVRRPPARATACAAPDAARLSSPPRAPWTSVAAGCLVLMVLLVGIGRVHATARARGWSLPAAPLRSAAESAVLRRWASPPRGLLELSVIRT
ncbi:hypothetical protein GCM10025862_40800 [Arsenicicoccus piscis]|uniref:Uncharacterized protein n=1 Tax=Arsenicicoccus piscis TaxID=673954 RepID=A0ABQ6HWJ2_9MICO|nr:hypothetical protein GCM10025862_40800 [Arsenicicoccus piscis]